jgi:hypothetical protein
MPFPTTIDEMRIAGYHFDNEAACRGCGARLEWWITPRGKKMPMDVDAEGNCEPHWATCPNAKDFKKQ